MAKYAELLSTEGDAAANPGFLLAYRKAVLLTLYRDGLINQEQLERCIAKLDER